jgi:phage terminase large subunit-like protein
VAANITAHTSTPNYTATANGAVITILAVTSDTSVNGFVVATTVVKATKTDVNMAGATANIVDSGGTEFATKAALITFLRANTGA